MDKIHRNKSYIFYELQPPAFSIYLEIYLPPVVFIKVAEKKLLKHLKNSEAMKVKLKHEIYIMWDRASLLM